MATGVNRRVSAASARAHTRNRNRNKPNRESSFPSGILRTALAVLFIGFLAWAYQAIQPPPPKICGSPDGPPITAPRIKLRDGRYMAYKEHGVPRDAAKYKIVFVHGLDCCRHDAVVADTLSPDVVEELGVYIVSFDRPGHGESDPDPNLTVKSQALDIEELADKLGLGSKFYIIGYSLGGQIVWGCLKYIPHRLASAALLNPAVNYWWSGLPANLTNEAFYQLKLQDQWVFRVAHYAPWLTYWWNTQQWFPSSSLTAKSTDVYSRQDMELLSKRSYRESFVVRQQGEYETVHSGLNFAFGSWEFSPLDLENPFPTNEGSVHIWQGDEDLAIAAKLQPYIAKKLPWIHYHELQGAGHLFPYADGMSDTIIKSLLLGKSKQDEKFGQEKEIGVIGRDTNGAFICTLLSSFVFDDIALYSNLSKRFKEFSKINITSFIYRLLRLGHLTHVQGLLVALVGLHSPNNSILRIASYSATRAGHDMKL
ncbi:hypothetical protein RIF29_39747 [Crotalaria pallida]|uniref:AB hydrolase-1 domain-containing protein n=1 Tax=Crotalaria pallida TaxID=3830 RepID=A0AAN9E1U0_CROPI